LKLYFCDVIMKRENYAISKTGFCFVSMHRETYTVSL
jgi:hypothetical protein